LKGINDLLGDKYVENQQQTPNKTNNLRYELSKRSAFLIKKQAIQT